MTAAAVDARPTRDECIHAAAEIYGAILADPEQADRIRAALAAQHAEEVKTA